MTLHYVEALSNVLTNTGGSDCQDSGVESVRGEGGEKVMRGGSRVTRKIPSPLVSFLPTISIKCLLAIHRALCIIRPRGKEVLR